MADLKITQLTEEVAPANADLIPIVDDVAGTPITKKATLENVLALARSKTSAHASPPSSPAAGDLWLPNNSFYAYRYSGSLWVPWGPIYPMTPPPAVSGFTWVNQGGASAVETNGGIHMSCPSSGSTNIRALVKSAPATPYTITAAFLPRFFGISAFDVGLVFRQSGDGKLIVLELNGDNGVPSGLSLTSAKLNSPTSWNANYVSIGALHQGLFWFQISDDGANRIWRFSADGQNWLDLHSVGRTDFLTADEVGFYVASTNATYGAAMTLLSWKET